MSLKVVSILYGLCLDTQLYPILSSELFDALQKLGYEISSNVPPYLPVGRISGKGDIAHKGKIVVRINSDSQQLLVVGPSIKDVKDHFNEILNMFLEDYNFDLAKRLNHYMYTGEYIYYTDKSAYQTLSGKFELSRSDRVSEIIGDEVSLYALNLAGSDLRVNSKNWYDIHIRPSYERDDAYIIKVVYRNESKDKTDEYLANIEDRIIELINYVEG